MAEKPPIGVKPKKYWVNDRVGDLLCAFERYAKAKKDIPYEWIEEFLGHYNDLKVGE